MKKMIYLLLSASLVLSGIVSAKEIHLKGKALFGDLRARHIGPALMSGRVIDLQTHPTDSRVIYAGTAGGGVWRSRNGGATFKPIFEKHAQSIGSIAIDPKKPDQVIWVGTGEIWTRNSVSVGDGLYKSTDGGSNWNRVGFEKSERISSIQINPNNSDEVYVAVLGALWGDSEERGIYKTTDGGKSWQQILYVNAKTGASDLVMDPANPNILYASMWEFRRTAWSFNSGGKNSALYKSIDGGKTWNKIHNGFPKGQLGRIAFTLAPSDSNRLYAVLETEEEKDKGLYRSDDAGKSWKQTNNDFGLVVRPFYFSRLTVDPKNPDVVVKAGVFGSISHDGGHTFKGLGQMHPDIHDIVFDINNSDRLYVATDGGVYRSWDGATTMEIVENLPISQFYHISVDNEEPYNVYGGLQDNGSWWGPNSAAGGVESRDWKVIGFGDGFRVLRHHSKKIIYSEMQGAQNIWRYNIKTGLTKTIQPLPEEGDPKLRFNWNAPIALSDNEDDRIYVGSQFLHVSNDMGNSWKKISPDLTTNDPAKQKQLESGGLSVDNSGAENHSTIFTIAESPINEDVIWVGTDDGNVQVTKNNGRKWTNVTANVPNLPANTWVYHIEASVYDKASAYAVFDGHTANDGATYVYKTTDYGKTWKSIVTDEIIGFARNLQEDTVNPDLLFLGTEFGLYVTIDGGQHWNKFTRNMPSTAVHFIELQKKTNDLVMGTHGRGIIIIDDISPLRELTQEVLNQPVHFFKSNPAFTPERGNFGGTSTETQFVGENPNRLVKISYYLKKRHIFGKLKLEIFDSKGQLLVELPAGKSKGINSVNWNHRIKPPRVASGKTLDFGGFTAPRVMPGKYKVVMTKGKKTYESSVTIIKDPKSKLSNRSRLKLHKTTMRLYDMTQDLAYMVYQIDSYIDLATQQKEAYTSADQLLQSLNQLKETLVITTGDNYVGSADPQLREDISKLYSKVASSFVPASKSEIKNLRLLQQRFDKAKKQWDQIKSNPIDSFEQYLKSKSLDSVQLQAYEDFVKSM